VPNEKLLAEKVDHQDIGNDPAPLFQVRSEAAKAFRLGVPETLLTAVAAQKEKALFPSQ
jgi:hypothetical protein